MENTERGKMTVLLLCALVLLTVALSLAVRWWFSGGGAGLASAGSIDTSVIAFGFPEERYRAMSRLMDRQELRAIERTLGMPSDLVSRLESGRRQVLDLYLQELQEDFQKAQWLYARAQATAYVATPGAVRELVVAWWRFRRLSDRAKRSARRGELGSNELEPLLSEVRRWFVKWNGGGL